MITSAGAVEVYDLEQDTVPKFSLMASGYDVAVASTEAQMDELLADLSLGTGSPSLYSLGYWLQNIIYALGNIYGEFYVGGLFYDSGYYLNQSGGQSTAPNNIPFTEFIRNGFLGLSKNIQSLSSSFDLSSLITAVNTITTAVNNNKSAVDLVRSAVNSTTAAVEDTTAAVQDTTAAVGSLQTSNETGFNSLFNVLTEAPGVTYFGSSGQISTTSYRFSMSFFIRQGFMGLADMFYNNGPVSYLGQNGVLYTSASGGRVDAFELLRAGFAGVGSSITGYHGTNSYSGTLLDNQNQTSSFSVSGLGPMLQRYLEEIQHDSGLLTYIFASPEDIEMKENSASSMDAINDSFIDPDSDTSVSVSDIGTLSSAAGSIESFGATGVTPDQAFAQLGNDSIFEFFSQTTADNLDSRPSSYSLRDPAPQIVTNYYSESRAEFFNLIGEGSE